MKTTGFSILVLLLCCFCIAFPLTWVEAFIPQTLGTYDTIYELRYGVDCRSCHAASLADIHHALNYGCVSCHTQKPKKVDDCLDCHDGHDGGEHHTSDWAEAWLCTVCHDPELIDDYQSVVPPFPQYPTSYTTPRPYRCKVCHNSSPNPPGANDPDPALVGIDGMSTATNTHHNARGAVFNPDTCDNCHDDTIPHTDPIQIRHCEQCHSPDKLHTIGPHAVSAHCAGCHSDTVVMEILDVWTSNWRGRPKKRFAPGGKIRFNVKYRIIGNPDVQHRVKVWGEAFGLPDRDWELPLDKKGRKFYPGEYIRQWKETIPLDAVPGTEAKVRVKMTVVGVGTTPYSKAKFTIK